jgi:hypothetical protein
MFRKVILASASAGAIGLGLLGFGIAEAANTIPPNTYHGCVTGSTRTLEHVYSSNTAGTTCPAGSFQAVWPNTSFTSGASKPTEVLASNVVGINASGDTTFTEFCPTGSAPLSGQIDFGHNSYLLLNSNGPKLTSPTGWNFQITNPTTNTPTVTASVLCASNVNAATKVAKAVISKR